VVTIAGMLVTIAGMLVTISRIGGHDPGMPGHDRPEYPDSHVLKHPLA